ncbi:WD40-repeat-containing domain protein [Cyathus striatus]|nr:WD40-repeat-containing domain protein [Cyathus striatus]
MLASGAWDKTIRIWNSRTFEGYTDWIASVAFSPDGKMLVSASWDYAIRIWDIETGKTIAGPIKCHIWIKSVVFSSDGKRIASGLGNGTVRIWDLERLLDDNEHLCAPKDSDNLFNENENNNHSAHSYQLKKLGGFNIYASCNNTSSDGWVKDQYGNLLFWVPLHLRNRLCSYEIIQMLGTKMVKLNLSKFRHGKNWTECYTPLDNSHKTPDELWEVSDKLKLPQEEEWIVLDNDTYGKEKVEENWNHIG